MDFATDINLSQTAYQLQITLLGQNGSQNQFNLNPTIQGTQFRFPLCLEAGSQDYVDVKAKLVYRHFDEKYIKLLMISTALPGEAFIVHSECEQESGYTDLQFRERPPYHVNYQYIFELKYLKKEDQSPLEKAQQKALEQLTEYLRNDRELQTLHSLKAYILVVMKDALYWREVEV